MISTSKRSARLKKRLNFAGTVLVISHDRGFSTALLRTSSLQKMIRSGLLQRQLSGIRGGKEARLGEEGARSASHRVISLCEALIHEDEHERDSGAQLVADGPARSCDLDGTMGARQSLGLFVSPLNTRTGLGIVTIRLRAGRWAIRVGERATDRGGTG